MYRIDKFRYSLVLFGSTVLIGKSFRQFTVLTIDFILLAESHLHLQFSFQKIRQPPQIKTLIKQIEN